MATDSKVADDSSTPPSYDTISASPIQCDQSSIFSSRRMKKKRTAVLSRICDIVLAPDFILSSVVPNVNACAAALPATEFSELLKQPNIEGHTALSLGVEEVISGTMPSVLVSDLRIACMITNDYTMFKELKFGNLSDRWSRCVLGCLPDEVQVHTCDGPTNQFDVVFRIRMFQKRLRTATRKNLRFEFVAGGRIWWFRFYILEHSNGLCCADIGLGPHSYQARIDAVLSIEAHSRKPDRAAPPEALEITLSTTGTEFLALAPWQ
ncbi:hypothetical protein C8R48DRAFT_773443 [Suillus tomentosus]|nr:hypothetical protein C8R48DRAFT_773443 [Suillus tomentosus]